MSVPPPLVYQIKIVLRGISPMIWRRVLLPDHEPLGELHRVIQVTIGWMDLHLHRFLIHGREYGLYRPGGPWFDQSADQVRLVDLALRNGEKFLYTYDFFDHWEHELRLEKMLPVDEKRPYPVCIGGKRKGLLEDSGGPWVYQKLIGLYKHGPLRDYLRLCLNLGELFDPNPFDRRAVNRKLKSGYWPEEIIRIARADDPLEQQLRQLLSLLDYGTPESPWEDEDAQVQELRGNRVPK